MDRNRNVAPELTEEDEELLDLAWQKVRREDVDQQSWGENPPKTQR